MRFLGQVRSSATPPSPELFLRRLRLLLPGPPAAWKRRARHSSVAGRSPSCYGKREARVLHRASTPCPVSSQHSAKHASDAMAYPTACVAEFCAALASMAGAGGASRRVSSCLNDASRTSTPRHAATSSPPNAVEEPVLSPSKRKHEPTLPSPAAMKVEHEGPAIRPMPDRLRQVWDAELCFWGPLWLYHCVQCDMCGVTEAQRCPQHKQPEQRQHWELD